jgi:hypothetical protein
VLIGEVDKVSTLIGSLRLSIVDVARQCGGIRQRGCQIASARTDVPLISESQSRPSADGAGAS